MSLKILRLSKRILIKILNKVLLTILKRFHFFSIFIFYFRPAVTELQNAAQVERVRKEKSVCFFLVTSNENPQLSEKLKVNVDWKCNIV